MINAENAVCVTCVQLGGGDVSLFVTSQLNLVYIVYGKQTDSECDAVDACCAHRLL